MMILGKALEILFVVVVFKYAPFKKGGKGSHAERARQLGLNEPAERLINDPHSVQLERLIDPNTEGNCKIIIIINTKVWFNTRSFQSINNLTVVWNQNLIFQN